jgi:hypothetical protein
MARFSKFYAALTAGALTWAAAVVTSAPADITASEWVTGAGVLVTAFAVWAVPNVPPE